MQGRETQCFAPRQSAIRALLALATSQNLLPVQLVVYVLYRDEEA